MASFGKEEYSIVDLLHLLQPFNVSETSLRTNLSRMKINGTLESRKEGKTVFYRFYIRGQKMSRIAELGFSPPSWEGWNNKWFGVIFSINEENKENRYKIRKRLQAYRFAPQYPGFWIRPLHPIEREKYKYDEIFNKEYCSLVELNFTQTLKTGDIQQLWNISEINREYKIAFNFLKEEQEKFIKLKPEEALILKMEIGNKMVNLIIKNPLLPPSYLPENWQGDDLRNEFFKVDKQLTEISKTYWNKIFTKT